MNAALCARRSSRRISARALERVLRFIAPLHIAAAAGCAGATTHSNGGNGGQAGSAAGGVDESGFGGASTAGVGGKFEPTCLDVSRLSTSCTRQTPVQLITAGSLGQNERFGALGGLAVLVDRAPDAPRVVTLRISPEEQRVTVLDVETGTENQVSISGVWGSPAPFDATGVHTVALGCDAAGCRLFGAAGDSKLVHLGGADLPTSAKVVGLAAGPIPREDTISLVDTLCAYGEGLYCFGASGWREVLPAAGSGTLTHVVIGRPSVAISALGRIFVEKSGIWTSQALPFGSVTSVSAERGFVAAVSPEGVYYFRAEPPAEAQCQPSEPLLYASPGLGDSGDPWQVLTQQGTVYRQGSLSNDWCVVSSSVPTPLLAITAFHCGASVNVLAITDSAFFSVLGPLECGIR